MKRTLFPKLIAAALCGIAFAIFTPKVAALSSLALILATLCLLTWPVLDAQSNFYIPTLCHGLDPSSIALTFDDGPDPLYTPAVLELLDKEGIQAAFFLVGERMAAHPELVKDILRRGHVIGNHSHTHALDFHFQLPRAYHEEIERFHGLSYEIFGKRCRFFRAPQGFRTPILADALRAKRLLCVGWTTRGFDSTRSDPRAILKSLRGSLRAGGIVLLHDGGGLGGRRQRDATLQALPGFIEHVKSAGFRFQRLDKHLGEEAYFHA
jgi:peptidoglycan/xylan/chitin deacetylase (PgdA/CDA1 family)